MNELTVNIFRRRRGRLLKKTLMSLARDLGRDLTILDVGGRPEYWENIKPENVSKIILLNNDERELLRPITDDSVFEVQHGDARDLSQYPDGSIDLVHSNSVIEHVGSWEDMTAMAREVQRVGRMGWVQTPAYEFPVEPHFRIPFVHWFGTPTKASLLWFSPSYRAKPYGERRFHAERINLLSHHEMKLLFPNCQIWTERIVLAKSYVAIW